MDYIVLNLEGNYRNWKMDQIGAARVNEKLDVQDTFHMKLVPEDRELFADAMEKFRLWCGDCPLVTWGQDDIWMLEHCISENGLDLDWMPEVFDGQEIFDEQMSGRRADLRYAMTALGLKPRAVRSALSQSLNMVKVLQNLSFTRGIEAQRWGGAGFDGPYGGNDSYSLEYSLDEMCDYGYELAG